MPEVKGVVHLLGEQGVGKWQPGQYEEVLQQLPSRGRRNGFGVELHAPDGMDSVAHRHDLLSCRAISRPSKNFKASREPVVGYNK